MWGCHSDKSDLWLHGDEAVCASAGNRRPFYRPAVEEMVVILQVTDLGTTHETVTSQSKKNITQQLHYATVKTRFVGKLELKCAAM